MNTSGNIKPTDKAIKAYYATLQAYSDQQVIHEGAVETAFQHLLTDTARAHGWMLIPKLPVKRGGKTIIPDGTIRDAYNLHRGYWEAKDTSDDLSAEIQKKMAKGYPLTNAIFEDTRRGVLFQNGQVRLDADLHDPHQLADLLNAFYTHAEPDIEGFEQAVAEFKERVPELALALAQKIEQAHGDNPKFQSAFSDFYLLCQSSLNPNISRAAVDEMLVQHLLTERLIRKIFDNPEFTHRNVIAAEVEKVIAALVSKSFNRDEFMRSLDRFYRAIENAAHVLEDFSEKQHFLNSVYERFFQGYSVKVADTHGIVYTPQEIVDFMCASVVEVLESEFGKHLGDSDVHVLDPCTGTGNFIVNLLRRTPKRQLPRLYREQLFANEIMLLPYYIAALNIEHAYYEITGDYEPFEGLCFVDTLDLGGGRQFQMFAEQNSVRVERQKKAPITVIIGNPPYNANQANENDNNKNRTYPLIDARIKQTYIARNSARKTKCYDPYVRFFRWAVDRLGNRDGIVCFVTNNSFVHTSACDGLQRCLTTEFSKIFHIDLKGRVRENPTLSGTAYNVFGIQLGVGITIAVRKGKPKRAEVNLAEANLDWRRAEKLLWLASVRSVAGIEWAAATPDEGLLWARKASDPETRDLIPVGTDEAKAVRGAAQGVIFKTFSLGISTNRDDVVYDFNRPSLLRRAEQFCDEFAANVDRYKRNGGSQPPEKFFEGSTMKLSRNLKRSIIKGDVLRFRADAIRVALYRPFTQRFLYLEKVAVDELAQIPRFLPARATQRDNRMIVVTGPGSEKPFMTVATAMPPDLHLVGAGAGGQCFPFYVYDENATNRNENITDWAVREFRRHYENETISKWDIFYYIYGLLHNPAYRVKFADHLKHNLPCIPLAPGFRAFSQAGQELARLHLDYEKVEEFPLKWIEAPDVPLSYHVEKMKLTKDKSAVVVNRSLTLSGIPPETFEYRLGSRSALDWVIDQHQINEDKQTGMRSDPNRPDDPEYIVRLIGQVVRVSVETVKIVDALPGQIS